MIDRLFLFFGLFWCRGTTPTIAFASESESSAVFVDQSCNYIEAFPILSRKKWTVAVYMNGDNELEPSITGGQQTPAVGYEAPTRRSYQTHARGDFHSELAQLGSSDDVHVVALIDRNPGYASNMDNWNNTRLYYISQSR